MNLPRFDRFSLMLSGALLVTGAAGCCCRNQPAGECPQVSTCPMTPQGAARAPVSAGVATGSSNTRVQARTPILDDKDAADWIGRPGRQFPPNDEPDTGVESLPPAFPDDSKENETAPAAKLSPLEKLRLKMADRRKSANSTNRTAAGTTQKSGSGNPASRIAAGPTATSGSANGFAAQARPGAATSSAGAARGTRLVMLSPPSNGYTTAAQRQRALPLPIDSRPTTATSRTLASATTSTTPVDRATRQLVENRSATGYAAVGPADQPPEWPEHQFARQSGSNSQALPAGLDGLRDPSEPGFEPVRMIDPPVLRSPPIDGGYDSRVASDRGLTIPRIQICRQVRGFEDVLPLDAQKLRQGQPVLIYATLEGFRSMATSKGYRTLTLSTLEIHGSDGELLQRQSLGPAVDLVEVPRRDFFLTHLVTIPEKLPVGEYIFELCVDDLLKHESAHARIAVGVTEDRSPRDGTADTSKFATRPAGSRR